MGECSLRPPKDDDAWNELLRTAEAKDGNPTLKAVKIVLLKTARVGA